MRIAKEHEIHKEMQQEEVDWNQETIDKEQKTLDNNLLQTPRSNKKFRHVALTIQGFLSPLSSTKNKKVNFIEAIQQSSQKIEIKSPLFKQNQRSFKSLKQEKSLLTSEWL